MLCYYSSYSSEPSGLVIAFLLLFAVWGILNVVLFFKLWGACDNIKKLAKKKPEGWDSLYFAGKKEEAAQALIKEMTDELNAIFDAQKARLDKDQRPAVSSFDALAFRQPIAKWERRLAKIGGGPLCDELRSGEAFIAWRLSVD